MNDLLIMWRFLSPRSWYRKILRTKQNVPLCLLQKVKRSSPVHRVDRKVDGIKWQKPEEFNLSQGEFTHQRITVFLSRILSETPAGSEDDVRSPVVLTAEPRWRTWWPYRVTTAQPQSLEQYTASHPLDIGTEVTCFRSAYHRAILLAYA
jgi:hypothetical protein